MDKMLPLFPLQLVVFPGENLNLHIFEPRYKQLIKECEEKGIPFGIPAYIDGKVMTVGTEVQLLNVEKRYPNGEMDIKTRGVGLFSIKEYFSTAPNRLYAAGDINLLPHDTAGDPVASAQILELVEELFSLMNIRKKIPADPNNFNTYELAHHVGFSLEQEYQFLCVTDERSRQEFMRMHLEKLIPIVKEMENLRKRAEMNGHFKNIIPPKA
ncbi:MAG: LON peptidase substrate-binding domain-containing protein [Phaeodactylibacter sp.]|nr:LON peptidase substrate-binding domain-containing protein [Phaeodactylibacter sp.]MCB9264687.1 LON peptidase substrate-binding domain-containing protein [Lewinellaceae bacterium]MCB9287102.1 LON peptidase substrate-binding domain-containing protein [Lewinellaceae bacterium]